MLKFVIVGTATLAFVGTAVAADLPRPQPVYPDRRRWARYPSASTPSAKRQLVSTRRPRL